MATKFYMLLKVHLDTAATSNDAVVNLKTEWCYGYYIIEVHPAHVELWREYTKDKTMVRRMGYFNTLHSCLTRIQAEVEKKRIRKERRKE